MTLAHAARKSRGWQTVPAMMSWAGGACGFRPAPGPTQVRMVAQNPLASPRDKTLEPARTWQTGLFLELIRKIIQVTAQY